MAARSGANSDAPVLVGFLKWDGKEKKGVTSCQINDMYSINEGGKVISCPSGNIFNQVYTEATFSTISSSFCSRDGDTTHWKDERLLLSPAHNTFSKRYKNKTWICVGPLSETSVKMIDGISPPAEPSYCIELNIKLCQGCDGSCTYEQLHHLCLFYFPKSRRKKEMEKMMESKTKLRDEVVKQFKSQEEEYTFPFETSEPRAIDDIIDVDFLSSPWTCDGEDYAIDAIPSPNLLNFSPFRPEFQNALPSEGHTAEEDVWDSHEVEAEARMLLGPAIYRLVNCIGDIPCEMSYCAKLQSTRI